MQELYADFVVIGSGPAGQKAAIQAAKLGKRVIVIEGSDRVGGNSLHSGTIPSKSLREATWDLTRFNERSFYGQKNRPETISINDLNFRLNRVIDEMTQVLEKQFEKNGIQLIFGRASFVSDLELNVHNKEGELTHRILGDQILIGAGSEPRNPEEIVFDDEVILDSTRLLAMNYLPKTMIVLGGGIIGSEYASFFAALGSEVSVVDKREHMLPLLDAEIGKHLQSGLGEIGLKFVGGKKPQKIYRDGKEAVVTFEDGTEMRAEALLYALGRVANVRGLQIDKAGLHVNQRGHIPVNALFQTAVPHIYAVGDVIGGPSLASTSMEQGRLAARHAFGAPTHHFPTFFPIGIYTIPEISSCGYTEEELQKMGFNYEVGRAYYYEIARGQISGSQDGLFKILFHADTLEILGVHIIGRGATEVIHIGQVAMSFRARLDYFIDQVFNYPTFAEGYRIAALNGLNKIKHRV